MLVDLTADDTVAALEQALTHGMDLVLANKRPLADRATVSDGLWQTARARGRRILHEATVGAGLPIIDTYHKLVESGDRVDRIEGLLSGTLGYVLSEVSAGVPFSRAVRSAMAKGYTEPDPRDDLSGMDVARKALILARLLGYQGELQPELGGIAGAEVGPVAVARGFPQPAGGARCHCGSGGWMRPPRKARCSAMWRGDSAGEIAVGVQAVPTHESAGRDQGIGQPAGVHHRPVQGQPTRHHRTGRRRRGDRRGRAQRHSAAGGRMTSSGSRSPHSRRAASATSGPGLDILGLALAGAGDTVRAEWTERPGIQILDPGHRDLPTDAARHTAGLAARAVIEPVGRRAHPDAAASALR